jgi:hypothetical protein
MKNLKSIIGQVFIIGFFLLIVFTDYLNPIKEYLPFLWTLILISSIYYSLKYRKGNVKSELRFPTNNDNYNKTSPFIIGSLCVIGGICSWIFIKEYMIFTTIMTLNGFLLIISGTLFIPSGMIRIKNDILNSVSGKQENKIDTNELNTIDLFENKIVFTDKKQKQHLLEHLDLKTSDYSNISDFINQNVIRKIEIKTYGNNV